MVIYCKHSFQVFSLKALSMHQVVFIEGFPVQHILFEFVDLTTSLTVQKKKSTFSTIAAAARFRFSVKSSRAGLLVGMSSAFSWFLFIRLSDKESFSVTAFFFIALCSIIMLVMFSPTSGLERGLATVSSWPSKKTRRASTEISRRWDSSFFKRHYSKTHAFATSCLPAAFAAFYLHAKKTSSNGQKAWQSP